MLKIGLLLLIFLLSSLHATPTSLFWTNCTTDIVPTGDGLFEMDNYFTVFNGRGRGQFFATDVGFTVGLFTLRKVQCEIGVDYIGGTDNPWLLNGKIGVQENCLFPYSPAVNVGVFNVGFGSPFNNNIFDFILGKTLPPPLAGRLFLAAYVGTHNMGQDYAGFMVGYERRFFPEKDCEGTCYHKLIFLADYASGRNQIGGGGFGFAYYFNPKVSITTGPVWFNSRRLLGHWKWSLFVDIQFSVFKTRYQHAREALEKKKKEAKEAEKKKEEKKEEKKVA